MRNERLRRSERRRESRDPITGEVMLVCQNEQGQEIIARAKLIDVSAHGARFRSLQELPVRCAAMFHHVALGIGGRGLVRYCKWSPLGYEIGVEFQYGTGWHGPSGKTTEREALSDTEAVEAAAETP